MTLESEPFKSCPRFKKCSVNNCPLHPSYPNLFVDPDDDNKKCTLAKNIRSRIASNFPGALKFEGLTPNEFKGRQTWVGKTFEEQQKTKKKLQEISTFKMALKEDLGLTR